MPVNFPDSPTTGDTYTDANKTWYYDGSAWTLSNTSPGAEHGALSGLSDDDHSQYVLANGTRVVDYLELNTVGLDPLTEAQIAWDEDEGTIALGLHSNKSILEVGQEVVYYVKNQTGSTISKGTVVRFNGTLGSSGRILVAPFLADGSYQSQYVMGVTAHEILNGEDGYVIHFGKLSAFNTSAWSDGTILYASSSSAGGFVSAAPSAPNNIVQMAAVVHSDVNNGVLFIRPSWAGSLDNNESINLASVADNDVLVYNSVSGVFENQGFDHGNIAGLGDDDHTQYLLADGTRPASSLTVSGTLNVDTSTLHVDATNNRVGIGTTSPSQALDVSGTAHADALATTGGTTNNRGILLAHQNNINYSYVGRSENGAVDVNNRLGWDYDDDSFNIKTGGVTALTIDSSANVSVGGEINATGGVKVAGNPVGLVLVKSQDIGYAVSSVTVTGAFSSAYDNYRVVLVLQDSSNNTAVHWYSPQETGSQYNYAGYYMNLYTPPTGANYFGAASTTSIQIGFTTANSTGDGGAMTMDIFGPNRSDQQTKCMSTSTTYLVHNIWGRIYTYTALSDITFSPVAGNFNGGKILIYGYAE